MLVKEVQRSYVRSHPVVFWLCIGLATVGFLGVVVPSSVSQSAASAVLPDLLRTAFYADYWIAGSLSVLGIARGNAKFEAAGMMMLATGFLSQFIVAAYLLHSSAFAGVFLVALAIGCLQRSRFLTKYGYPPQVKP